MTELTLQEQLIADRRHLHAHPEEGCGFDWSGISPTIFGSIFESTLNPATRRHGGMHYTSIENIHKVIDPLFLDAYKERFHEAMQEKQTKRRIERLRDLQRDLGRGQYFDPACGSGNFLTESYPRLRQEKGTADRPGADRQEFRQGHRYAAG